MTFKPFNLLLLTLISVICLTFNDCSVITRIYGIRPHRKVDEKAILFYCDKYNVPTEECYQLDTSYISFIKSLDSMGYKTQKKNHYQPLQALYYDKSGQLQSFQVNCYAGGFPNLKWNRNDIMTTFPPKQQAPPDSVLPIDTMIKFLRPLSQSKIFSTDEYDYIVVVHWSRFMGRQSKRLIRFVQRNSKLASNKKVKLVYVINDNIFTPH